MELSLCIIPGKGTDIFADLSYCQYQVPFLKALVHWCGDFISLS